MTTFTPRYAIIGDRPVKTALDDDGLMFVYAWDWDRRIFVKAPEYFTKLYTPGSPEVEMLDEDAFQEKVDDLLFA